MKCEWKHRSSSLKYMYLIQFINMAITIWKSKKNKSCIFGIYSIIIKQFSLSFMWIQVSFLATSTSVIDIPLACNYTFKSSQRQFNAFEMSSVLGAIISSSEFLSIKSFISSCFLFWRVYFYRTYCELIWES